MSHVSKEIYRKINKLFPDLQEKEPFTTADFKIKGANINMVMLDSSSDEIYFVLSRYGKGELKANVSVEICVNPKAKTANVKTYKDDYYFHTAVPEPDEIGQIALCQANYFLNDWLRNLKNWNRNKSINKIHEVLDK